MKLAGLSALFLAAGLSTPLEARLQRLLPDSKPSCTLTPCQLEGDFDGDGKPDTALLAEQKSGRQLVVLGSAGDLLVSFQGEPQGLGTDCSSASCLKRWAVVTRKSAAYAKLPASVQRDAKGDVFELEWSDGAGKALVFFGSKGQRKHWYGAD